MTRIVANVGFVRTRLPKRMDIGKHDKALQRQALNSVGELCQRRKEGNTRDSLLSTEAPSVK